MIRAHLATFPIREGIFLQSVQSILPQVDRLFTCLNLYDRVPEALRDHPKIETLIPDRDLKDAGKFAFPAAPDDLVFTIDDDILYPPDYVATTLRQFQILDPKTHILGQFGTAYVPLGKDQALGWKTWGFSKHVGHLTKVDVLGTGTTCLLGQNMPRLDDMASGAGFIDLRHAQLQVKAGRWLWVMPHAENWMTSTMTKDLAASSLFQTYNRAPPPEMLRELAAVYASLGPHSGQKFRDLVAEGLVPDLIGAR